MRKCIFGVLLVGTVISGCATNTELIKASSVSSKSDVFQEVTAGSIPQGYADLVVLSSLKTHHPGAFVSAKDIHGTSDYTLLLNIDGQAVRLQGELRPENTEAHGPRDAEGGHGVRYRFYKKMRLKSGAHRVVTAIPTDEVAVEREITLAEGSSNRFELVPVYSQKPGKQRPGFYGVTSFMEGIRTFRLLLNDKDL